jgi:transposase InsO family protein
MNALYRSIGISKQSFHQKEDRWLKLKSEQNQLLLLIYQIREDHPTMGARDMYHKLQPQCMGRDAFESFCKAENLTINRTKNYRITTDSSGVIRFDNLLINLVIDRINQVWQSDITYFEIQGRFYYITFIIDACSRRVVGHQTSKRLTTEQTTLPALQMAIRARKKEKMNINSLIFHSDGGGQYYAKTFLKLTGKHGIKNSMCEYAWENGKAERINGVIKNNYLIHRKIESFEDLQKEVDRSVNLYNKCKPHINLQRKTPIEYEKNYIWNGQKADSDKSATKSGPRPQGQYSPADCGQKTSSSNIARKSNENKSSKKLKTVNAI